MIEQDGFEISSFIVSTPSECALNYAYDDEEKILDELGHLGVSEVGHYHEFFVTVDRDYSIPLKEQYYQVVEGLKKILNNC